MSGVVTTGEGTTVILPDVISEMKYKPGWHFDMGYHSGQRYSLVINAEVLHSATLKPVTFVMRRLIPRVALADEGTFLSWAEDVIAEAEIHEVREFFRYKGELVDDPHKSVPVGQEG
jgi:hypothetical protein